MAPRHLHYTRKASRDLESIADHLQEEASALIALRFLDAIDRTTDLLLTTPQIGVTLNLASGHYRRARRIPVHSPFERWTIFYTPSTSELRIHRVIHSAQNWPRFIR
jgi:plasmid stabilization system protein ParE